MLFSTLRCSYGGARDAPIVFYCAVGERSAMAVSIALAGGVKSVMHLVGGFEAYKDVTNPFLRKTNSFNE